MPKYLITGGTGTLGQHLVHRLIRDTNASDIRVYSRDEYKQSEMARRINSPKVTYWLGDVRNLHRLQEASVGVDTIIHTAAMKRMDTISRNVFELVDVNILGTKNVMIAGRDCERVIFVSSDKAYQPSCIYGASKMIAEGIVLAYDNGVVWRFGNFIGSRGSVWEIFEEQKKTGTLTIMDAEATRFIISLDEVCDCLLSGASWGIHYPKMRVIKIMDLAKEIAPDAKYVIIGPREGEKTHEALSEDYSSDKVYESNHHNGVLEGGKVADRNQINR